MAERQKSRAEQFIRYPILKYDHLGHVATIASIAYVGGAVGELFACAL